MNQPFALDSLREMQDAYFWPGSTVDESLSDIAVKIKDENPAPWLEAVCKDIDQVLRLPQDEFDRVYHSRLLSYFAPEGMGLTPREWLKTMMELLRG